jgi:hypothetical protein
MAETADTAAPTETESTDTADTTTETTTETETVDWKAEAEKWKANSRKNEENAKANAAAAKRLKELEQANLTETEKLTEALKEAQTDATTSRAELAKLRAAVKHGLSEDDLELLGNGDPDEIEERAAKLAARLAVTAETQAKKPVSGLGKTPENPSPGSQFERDLREALGI